MRTAAWCALIYLLCLPLAPSMLAGLTRVAAGVLRLIERPPILTTLSSRGDHVVVATHLGGTSQPLVSWDAGNLPIFLVATLGLALAAPASNAWRRIQVGLFATAATLVVMLATVVIQLQVVADNQARATLGLRLHDARGYALLAAANQAIGVAMLLLPAVVFVVAYLRFRAGRAAPQLAPARRGRGLLAPAGLLALLLLAFAVFAVLPGTTVDPRPGLVRVIELNPEAPQSHGAVAYYDALAGRVPAEPPAPASRP